MVQTSTLDQALSAALIKIPDCFGVGFVDMGSGLLLGSRTVGQHPPEILDLTAAATRDMFMGDTMLTIERLFRQARGEQDNGKSSVRDFSFTTDRTVHLFLRGEKRQDRVFVIICKSSVNFGMLRVKAREQLPLVEAAV